MTSLTRFLFNPRLNIVDALVIAAVVVLLQSGMPLWGVVPIVLVWAPISVLGERKWGR